MLTLNEKRDEEGEGVGGGREKGSGPVDFIDGKRSGPVDFTDGKHIVTHTTHMPME